MKRGEFYRIYKPKDDPKRYRTFVVVSRQALIDSSFSSVTCAPVYTRGHGLSTQVAVGPDEG
jgi:mRNA interferase MazF